MFCFRSFLSSLHLSSLSLSSKGFGESVCLYHKDVDDFLFPLLEDLSRCSEDYYPLSVLFLSTQLGARAVSMGARCDCLREEKEASSVSLGLEKSER